MDLDFKHLEKNGYLTEADYNKLAEVWLKVLNPLRTKSIRKYLNFSKLKYSAYKDSAEKYKPNFDEAIDLDATFIPMFFVTSFPSSLFPTFCDEYFSPFDYLTNRNFITMEGLRVVEPSSYHSLCYAAYELETEIHQRFQESPVLNEVATETVVLNQFLVPMDVTSEFPFTITLCINMVV